MEVSAYATFSSHRQWRSVALTIRVTIPWFQNETKAWDRAACVHSKETYLAHVSSVWANGRGVISTFLGGGANLFYVSIPPDYWKLGKKHHFICSNLTLSIIPFFLSFFFSFFLFSWRGGGATASQPPQMTPLPNGILIPRSAPLLATERWWFCSEISDRSSHQAFHPRQSSPRFSKNLRADSSFGRVTESSSS